MRYLPPALILLLLLVSPAAGKSVLVCAGTFYCLIDCKADHFVIDAATAIVDTESGVITLRGMVLDSDYAITEVTDEAYKFEALFTEQPSGRPRLVQGRLDRYTGELAANDWENGIPGSRIGKWAMNLICTPQSRQF